MTALPLVIKAAISAALLVSIWRAFVGPPPDHRDVGTARLWGATAGILYVAGVYALAIGHDTAPFLVGTGIFALCLAFWHARGDDGGGGGGGGEDDDGDGPLDWDRFDRERRDWERPLVGT